MVAEVKENIGTIRGVNVRSLTVVIAGHTVEQLLLYDVAEAEAEYGRPFDAEMDEYIQEGYVCNKPNCRRRDHAQGCIGPQLPV